MLFCHGTFENHTRKEVNKMKRALTLIMALAFVGMGISLASAEGVITNLEQVIHVHTEFNAFGVATRQVTTTTTTTTTSDGKGGTSTTVEVSTAVATWHGGSLKTDTVHVNSRTDNSDGTWSESDYTDTYVYSPEGVLQSVSGSGTYTAVDDKGHKYSGTITRTFIVRDGQALLTSSVTTGDILDKDGKHIGTFTNTTTINPDDYQYLGGSWVPMKVTSTSTTNWDSGSYQTITRVTTYTRNDQGVITGMSQTATGEYVEVTGQNGPGEVARRTYTLQNYSCEIKFDSQVGWYVASEDYDWVLQSEQRNPGGGGGDPVVYGTVIGTVTINGVTYIQVAAEYVDILDGQGLQEADGEIFLIECDGEELATLEALVGQEVMLMGDIVGGAMAGAVAVFDINPNYGGGMITDVPQDAADAAALENLYQGEAWYQENLSVMAQVWGGIQVDWQTGVQRLADMIK